MSDIPLFLRPRNHIVRNSKKAGRHDTTERKRKRNEIDNFNDMVLKWNQHIRKARINE
jgi:hypothetical protein